MTQTTPRSHLRGAAMIAVAAIGWGTWPLFLRAAERDAAVSPALEALAPILGLTLVSGFTLTRDRLPARASGGDWASIAVLGVADAMNVFTFFAAYQRTSVAIAVVTHYLTPLFVALVAPWVVGERFRARTLLFVLISLSGLVLLLKPWGATRQPGDLAGAALGATSAACYATNVLVSKRLGAVFSGSELALFHGVLASLILWLLTPSGALSHLSPHATRWLVAGAALPGATSGLLFFWGLRSIRASQASTLTLLEPLVATILASLTLHQLLDTPSIIGGVFVVGGALLLTAEGAYAVA